MTRFLSVVHPVVWVVLGVALGLRLLTLSYGIDDACLVPEAEYWLYSTPERLTPFTLTQTPSSLASWALSAQAVLLGRLLGAFLGVGVVWLTITIAQKRGSSAWWLAGALVAVAPPFVQADRWLMAYDVGLFLVALAVFSLQEVRLSKVAPFYAHLASACAVLLVLLVPPLWWLSLIVLILLPQREWRTLLFIAIASVVLLPLLRSPLHWANALASWDASLNAVLVWLILIMGVFYWEDAPIAGILGGSVLVVLFGGLAVWDAFSLPRPSAPERALIALAQDVLPDDATVFYSADVWHLRGVIACPMANDVRVASYPTPVLEHPSVAFTPERSDYVIRKFTDPSTLAPLHFTSAPDFVIEKMDSLALPVNLAFGNQFRLLSMSIETPVVTQGNHLILRLMFQYSPIVNVETLAYGYYFHVTLPNQPAEKIANFGLPLVEGLGTIAPRQIVNQRVIVPLQSDAPLGMYEIRMGASNSYTGEALRINDTDEGQVILGAIEIIE